VIDDSPAQLSGDPIINQKSSIISSVSLRLCGSTALRFLHWRGGTEIYDLWFVIDDSPAQPSGDPISN
jgi:hypothetical protein